jgi:curved DNA-binding protein CbpA
LSPYATLGVSKTASIDEVKKAYRKKTLESHPDKHGNTPEATDRFREIQHAYDVLSDAKRRSLHDLGMPDEDPTSPRTRASPFGMGVSRGFKSSGDVRVDLVATSTSFAELVVHNVKNGIVKNTLIVALAITAAATAGWWGWLVALSALFAVGWSAKGWIRIFAKSPMVTPGTKK